MANIDAPRGFTPVKYANGTDWSGATTKCYVSASDGTRLGIGDTVVLDGTNSDPTGKYMCVKRGSGTTTATIGVVHAIQFDPDNPTRTYRPADTAMYIDVITDPNVIFRIQEDSDGGALAATAAGQYASFVTGNCSTSTGRSIFEIDSSSANGTASATLPLILLGVDDRPDNALGTNADWLVMFANHYFKNVVLS